MFAAAKEINQAKLVIKVQGEEFAFWSGPSKPAYLRGAGPTGERGFEHSQEIG